MPLHTVCITRKEKSEIAIECVLESMDKAVDLGVGLDYIKFAAERDADIEFAGIKVYPVPKGLALPLPGQ